MPSPLGARCRSPLGGFIRSPLGAFDCPGGCPTGGLEITLSGVDAAICSTCITIPSPLGSHRPATLSADGVYVLPFDGVDLFTGYCRYNLFLPAGNYGSVDIWAPSTTCAGAATSTETFTGGQITVTMDPDTGEFDEVGAGLTSATRGWNLFAANATGKTYGEAIANAGTCANYASDGGTATIEIA